MQAPQNGETLSFLHKNAASPVPEDLQERRGDDYSTLLAAPLSGQCIVARRVIFGMFCTICFWADFSSNFLFLLTNDFLACSTIDSKELKRR